MGTLKSAAGAKSKTEYGVQYDFRAPLSAPVVIADDDPALREELEDFLSKYAPNTSSVTDHTSLIQTLERSTEPAIVLLDLHMPGSDICDVLASLGSLPKPSALILFSGKHESILEYVARLAEAKNLQVVGTLSKPLSQDALWPLLRNAEEAIGQPQDNGFSPDIAWKQPLTRPEFRRAFERGEFESVYQPIFSFCDGRCHTVEALARWRHPVRGVLKPHDFLSEIKRSGLLGTFSEAVIRSVLKDMQAWHRDGVHVNVALNFPPTLLEDGAFSGFLLEEIEAHGLDPAQIVLEIVEDELLPDPEPVLDALIRLRVAGVRISIDDFGAEYSSLNRLLWLPISELKVDRSIIAAVEGTKNARIIIRNTVELAHQMGLSVVAEGVETDATLQELNALGCDSAQGFLLSYPVPAKEITALTQSNEQFAGTAEARGNV